MRHSLLYREADAAENTAEELDENRAAAVYNFSIDRSMEEICTDLKKRRVFVSVISKPCVKKETVLYRQNILRDFARMPLLFNECTDAFGKLEAIKSEWDFQRRKLYSLKRTNVAETSLDDYRALLSITSEYAQKVFKQLKKIAAFTTTYEMSSPGLPEIAGYCAELVGASEFADIERITTDCRGLSSRCIFDLSVKLSETLRITDVCLCGIEHVDLKDTAAPPPRGIFKLFKKPSEPQSKAADTADTDEPEVELKQPVRVFDIEQGDKTMLTSAMRDLEALMTRLLRVICEMFADIPRELMFYEVALAYVSSLRFKNVPYTYPEIKDANEPTFICKTLYDFHLISHSLTIKDIVPNDVCIGGSNRGVLVRGKNNSGKTVYMRSIGTAQLFAQAGLPVCAEKATVSIRTAIFTQFAQAEKVAAAGDTSGHFEEEVKGVCAIIDALQPYSLVMFNETFQSTAYDEGADGLYDILRYIASTGSCFIAVTHLTKLFSLFTDEDKSNAGVVFMHTEEGYKLATE